MVMMAFWGRNGMTTEQAGLGKEGFIEGVNEETEKPDFGETSGFDGCLQLTQILG